ncbi:Phosphoglycolate phosphatase [uncultured archaeon]|nr:Phosphoglycolate phosphatase [uncultured archaeon]
MAIKAIIFDIDGVLADSREAVVHNTKELMHEYGYATLDRKVEGMSSAHSAESVLTALAPELEHDQEKMKEMLARLSEITAENMGLVKPTLLVEKLPALSKKYLLAAATNRKRSAHMVLEKFGVEKYFGAVLTSADCPPKPHPEMLLKAAEKICVKPSGCMFVGDNREDEQAAVAAGMRFMLVDGAKGEEGCRAFLKEFC